MLAYYGFTADVIALSNQLSQESRLMDKGQIERNTKVGTIEVRYFNGETFDLPRKNNKKQDERDWST